MTLTNYSIQASVQRDLEQLMIIVKVNRTTDISRTIVHPAAVVDVARNNYILADNYSFIYTKVLYWIYLNGIAVGFRYFKGRFLCSDFTDSS